jgi:hypothetical protein
MWKPHVLVGAYRVPRAAVIFVCEDRTWGPPSVPPDSGEQPAAPQRLRASRCIAKARVRAHFTACSNIDIEA